MSFIWSREIESINGNEIIFKDGGKEYHTPRAQQYLVTEEAVEDEKIRYVIEVNIAADIIKVLMEHDAKLDYLYPIWKQVEGNLQGLNDQVYIKALNLEGNSDGEKLRSIRISHLEKFLTS